MVQRATIESRPLLTSTQCEIARNSVTELKSLWRTHNYNKNKTGNHIPHPFYTLGVPSYLGATNHDKEKHYYEVARELNPVMMQKFQWLYEIVMGAVSHMFQEPVRFTEDLAIPGFHIFPTQKGVHYPSIGMHLDLQFKLHQWKDKKGIDFKNPLSFTLPFSLSETGGGLNICDRPIGQMMFMSDSERQKTFDEETRYIPYALGELVVHRGLWFHEVAERQSEHSDSDRITLQGHGLRDRDGWTLYW